MSAVLRSLAPAAAVLSLAAGSLAAQPQPDLGSEEQRQAGQVVYQKYCAQCHGDEGDGQGIAAPYLRPRPRDFTAGKYKVRSTPTGALPTDADLEMAIKNGLPYTAMPGFPNLSETELDNVIYYLKSFSGAFENAQNYVEPLPLPKAPQFDDDAAEIGRRVYEEIGCARCHGDEGRGDGRSAPTLVDDWGDPIRPADLTMPWTFRGGSRPEDIYRSISTGFNGTPMAGFADGLTEEQLWQIVGFIVAQAGGRMSDPYSSFVTAMPVEEIELGADPAAARELFADAPGALFPTLGQIVEPGRGFHPWTTAVGVKAIYDDESIALMVSWHDMTAETSGHNGPDLDVPLAEERLAEEAERKKPTAAGPATDIWGQPLEEQPAAPPATDIWGQPLEGAAEGSGSTGGFWDEPAAEEAVAVRQTEFSDAVAVQLPLTLPESVVKPYFLFGDAQNPVELWFADLAEIAAGGEVRLYEGRGSENLLVGEGTPPEVLAHYEDGEWSVIFKRPRTPGRGVGFVEQAFVPVAFSVWDGYENERGSKRALTRWVYVYLEPGQRPSPVGPMTRAALAVFGLEVLVIALVRRRRKGKVG